MHLAPSSLPASRTAFFLDFDGTLADIVTDPALASVDQRTLAALGSLQRAASGAVAVVSGRGMDQLDRMLRPLRLPLAGVHGLERRTAEGETLEVAVDGAAQQRLEQAVRSFAERHDGLLAEPKRGSVALHFRNRPELETDCLALAERVARDQPGVRLLHGKMVVEMKLAARTKGDAIADFMAETPFSGRRPFFAGDDVTDEAGFAVVNAMGGLSLKVGPGESCATHRIADTTSFRAWLATLAEGMAD